MESLLVATVAVAVAEIGDKTQLLSLVLAARYRKPWPILLGIVAATLANHALAASFGALVADWLAPWSLRWLVALSLFAVAAWTLVPDRLDEEDAALARSGRSVFVTSLIAFFLAEMGDKTQVATVILAAQYPPLWQVIAGTTLGMLAANAPVLWLGSRFASRLPLAAIRIAAALLFAAIGVWVLLH